MNSWTINGKVWAKLKNGQKLFETGAASKFMHKTSLTGTSKYQNMKSSVCCKGARVNPITTLWG